MSVYVDLQCDGCGLILEDQWSHRDGYPCPDCNGTLIRMWTLTKSIAPGTHPSEKVVVYQSASEGGKLQYPMRNDVPMPERLQRRGYERVELNVRDLAGFERRHGVVNERRHYDRNGRGHDA